MFINKKTCLYVFALMFFVFFVMFEVKAQTQDTDVQDSFTGVGIELGEYDNTIVVLDVLEGSPASKAGIKIGDEIVKINDNIVYNGTSAEEICSLVRGNKEARVKFTVKHFDAKESKEKEFIITKELVKFPSESEYAEENKRKKGGEWVKIVLIAWMALIIWGYLWRREQINKLGL